tara:strand:+ start:1214 stop:1426 length:213 start_codon:yes stop_codon:yes gene_type:complete
MKPLDKIRRITQKLTDYRELLESLEEIDTIYETLDWVDIYKPHHIGMELSQAIYDVMNKIEEIEYKLEAL